MSKILKKELTYKQRLTASPVACLMRFQGARNDKKGFSIPSASGNGVTFNLCSHVDGNYLSRGFKGRERDSILFNSPILCLVLAVWAIMLPRNWLNMLIGSDLAKKGPYAFYPMLPRFPLWHLWISNKCDLLHCKATHKSFRVVFIHYLLSHFKC